MWKMLWFFWRRWRYGYRKQELGPLRVIRLRRNGWSERTLYPHAGRRLQGFKTKLGLEVMMFDSDENARAILRPPGSGFLIIEDPTRPEQVERIVPVRDLIQKGS